MSLLLQAVIIQSSWVILVSVGDRIGHISGQLVTCGFFDCTCAVLNDGFQELVQRLLGSVISDRWPQHPINCRSKEDEDNTDDS
jgi:hypothetical protein